MRLYGREFLMPGLCALAWVWAWAWAGEALADGPAAAGRKASLQAEPVGAMRTYPYEEGRIYALVAAPGRITDIVLEPGESLVGSGPIAAGDTARWVIGDTVSGEGVARRVHVLAKPVLAGLATNLIINTDRRTYHLELRSTASAWLAQVAWRYPAPPPAVMAVPPPAPDPARLNFGYRIEGARVSWRPSRVFDDGARTYVEFAPGVVMTDLPPLFVVGGSGESLSELVNYRVVGQRIVVDRLLERAELRLGQGRGERRVRLIRELAR